MIARQAAAQLAQTPLTVHPTTGAVANSAKDANGNTLVDSAGLGSVAVKSVLASKLHTNGQTLVGLGGGGDVLISRITFSLQRAAQVELVASSAGLVNTSSGPIQLSESVVCKVDGTYSLNAQGFLSVFGAAPAGTGSSQTLFQVVSLSAGPHTVDFVWVSAANTETFTDFADSIYAFLLGS